MSISDVMSDIKSTPLITHKRPIGCFMMGGRGHGVVGFNQYGQVSLKNT
jgi:hypothetical protein